MRKTKVARDSGAGLGNDVVPGGAVSDGGNGSWGRCRCVARVDALMSRGVKSWSDRGLGASQCRQHAELSRAASSSGGTDALPTSPIGVGLFGCQIASSGSMQNTSLYPMGVLERVLLKKGGKSGGEKSLHFFRRQDCAARWLLLSTGRRSREQGDHLLDLGGIRRVQRIVERLVPSFPLFTISEQVRAKQESTPRALFSAVSRSVSNLCRPFRAWRYVVGDTQGFASTLRLGL